jgi:MFS family permease
VQQAEDSSLTATTWLLTGFTLAAVASAPLLGRLGDMYGKRRLLLVSVRRSAWARSSARSPDRWSG